jgi:hypothetical protein
MNGGCGVNGRHVAASGSHHWSTVTWPVEQMKLPAGST